MASMPRNATLSQLSLAKVIFSPRNNAAKPTSMNGCTLYTAVPMAIEAREYEANNSNQLPTMATPLAIASSSAGRLITPGRRKPNAAQMTSKVTAPNTQRQNTTSSTGRPDASTNPPMVPEISMAATISSDPGAMNCPSHTSSRRWHQYAGGPVQPSSRLARQSHSFAFTIKANSATYPLRCT